MNCSEAKLIPIVDFLDKQGYKPVTIKKNGQEYWYLSLFRDENNPSFKVNLPLNLWFDFGSGHGGDIITLGRMLLDKQTGDLLKYFDDLHLTPNFSFRQQKLNMSNQLTITSITKLSHSALVNYLEQRKIKTIMALQYCHEVHYKVGAKNYFGIGFRNNSGGYELRNKYFKGSTSPKDVSLINPGKSVLAVFEGFFDFLSYRMLNQNRDISYLVLNSTSNFERAQSVIQKYEEVESFLDNDQVGRIYTDLIMERFPQAIDQSKSYSGYKDLNEWLCNQWVKEVNF